MTNGQQHYRFIYNDICEECPSQDWPIHELNKIELPKHGIKIEASDTPTDAIIEKFDKTDGFIKFLDKIYVKVTPIVVLG